MSTHATAVFEVKTWDEKPYQEIEGGSKLTRASVTKRTEGASPATGTATCDCTVVPDSGSGELRGLRGEGRYLATHVDYPNVPFTLDYSFE